MESNETPTRLGIISFALTMVPVVLWAIFYILYAATSGPDVIFGVDAGTGGFYLIFGLLGMTILTFPITLVGTILGIFALLKKDPKRGLVITGLVLNFLCFGLYCFFLLWVASIF